VLVTEDDEDLRMLVSMLLEGAGFVVQTAKHGEEALQRVEEHMPDLILLDMKMPVMDGWQFAKAFRDRHDGEVPIVVMTAAEHAAKRAREIDAVGWLSKPFECDELINEVEAHLRR
jgi:urea transport system substrate-binding protein